MDEKEATRSCDTCHKDVAEANFALHETHCRRFLCLCPDCEEPVPREQLEQHREEQHAEVRCSKCHLKMERRHLVDHESEECEERLQSCPFCELELPHKDLDGHRLACGSRTELCLDCGRYVTLKDRPGHEATCSATDGESAPPLTAGKPPPSKTKTTASCSRCMASFPAEDEEEHELACLLATRLNHEEAELTEEESEEEEEEEEEEKEEEEEEEEEKEEGDFSEQRNTPWLSRGSQAGPPAGYLSDRPRRGTGADAWDPDQISTCPHCHLALPLVTLRWHEVKCQLLLHLKERERVSYDV